MKELLNHREKARQNDTEQAKEKHKGVFTQEPAPAFQKVDAGKSQEQKGKGKEEVYGRGRFSLFIYCRLEATMLK